jgi:outer membrane protein assembly factor BamB
MYCSGHFRVLLLSTAILFFGLPEAFSSFAQGPLNSSQSSDTEVHLRWGARPGVARYRLQLATDSSFGDIIFDRVVAGNDYQMEALEPGRYFWRVAPLTKELGEFSSAGVIEVSKTQPRATPTPFQKIQSGKDPSRISTGNPILARGGWRAAVGDIAHPVLAHLRSSEKLDLVGMNSEGIIFALDAGSGIALWSTGRKPATSKLVVPRSSGVVLLSSRSGLDNVIAMSDARVTAIEGATGRELWQTTLPAAVTNATVVSDGRSAAILLIDNSLQRLLTLDAVNGNLVSQIKLPHRVVGAPLNLPGQGRGQIVLAYDTGQVEIRNIAGGVVRSGDAGSPALTPPLFIRGRSGDVLLVGTQGGLTALTAGELNPLGMVAIKGDAPRGTLAAEDLDRDGSPEVIMMTQRGRLIAVSGTDGKTIWEATVGSDAQSVTFADVDADRVLDVIVASGQGFAFALSGRDGSVVWKDNEQPGLVANHAVALAPRSIVTMPYGSGALLIASDPFGTGLRALEFPKGTAPLKR